MYSKIDEREIGVLRVVRLQPWVRFNDLTREEIGALHTAFRKEFHSWTLVTRWFTDLRRGDEVVLLVVNNAVSHDEDKETMEDPTQEDRNEMRRFIHGFVAGIRYMKNIRREASV